jgi:hypothetical protein
VGGGRGDGELDAWAAGARAQDAAAARTRRRWLRQQAHEQSDFTSLLIDVCERAATTTVITTGGRAHRGRITNVGRDCVVLVTTGGRTVVLATHAVAAVRPDGERTVTLALDPRRPEPLSLAEIVRARAIDRPMVTVHLAGGREPLVGELQACGIDVVALLLAGEPPAPAYLRLASVSEMSFDSG